MNEEHDVAPAPLILVIDDDSKIVRLVDTLLTQDGYRTAVASTAKEGLARLEMGDVDLVLLDLMLPDRDGRDVCRRVREQQRDVYLPIIMLTGLTSEEERHKGFSAGADDYLCKPFGMRELLDRVNVWLQTRVRLRAAHERLVAEYTRRRELEQRALRQQLAQDQAVLAMARTASDQLNQPLTTLLGWLELWQESNFEGEPPARVHARLSAAAAQLASRIEALTHVVRYEPREVAGSTQLDIARARRPRVERE